MAIFLEVNYAKRLGLPHFSSHQYSVTIRTEINDLSQVDEESAKLYRQLQDAVDREMKEVGFIPDGSGYGSGSSVDHGAGNQERQQGSDQGRQQSRRYQNVQSSDDGIWRCSEKQRGLIERIVHENHLDKHEVENIAIDLFGVGVRQLDKLQASGLIDELFDRFGGRRDRRGNGDRSFRRDRLPSNGGSRQ